MSSDVSDKVREFFAPQRSRTFSKGQILIYKGDDPDGISYLVKGEVRQYDISPSGEELVVNVYKPGAFFPMFWAINKSTNNFFFDAASKVEIKQAPAGDTLQFIKDNPDVMLDLLSRLYVGVDGLLQRMTQLMGSGAYSRVIFELINSTKRFGKQQSDGAYKLDVSEVELAKRAGLTRETFNKELRKLKDQKAITVIGGQVVIHNLKALEKQIEN